MEGHKPPPCHRTRVPSGARPIVRFEEITVPTGIPLWDHCVESAVISCKDERGSITVGSAYTITFEILISLFIDF